MTKITFDYSQAQDFFDERSLYALQERVENIHQFLHTRTKENDYKGWVELPENSNKIELKRIKRAAKKIKLNSDILLVIGVGGSYLGAKAAIDMLGHSFSRLLLREHLPHVIFVGHNLNATYVRHVKEVLKNRDFSINVISKSGTTTEPAIALRIFKKLLLDRYGREGAKERIFITTDATSGALATLARERDYETFVIPYDVGGRYSVLTAVGLLPMAVSGIDIEEVIKGAKKAQGDLSVSSLETNAAYQYATARNILYEQDKTVELLVNYELNMETFSKWWQQLFGESEGKNSQGIYPSFVTFPTDLHSIGQYIQDGRRDLFETIIKVTEQKTTEFIHYDEKNIDELNYLAGKSLEEINEKAFEGAMVAHVEGGVPNLVINVPEISSFTFGYLVYYFQKACAMSSYLFEVNPFNQPGVEAYKNNMFALLGKPGFENQQRELERRFNLQRAELLNKNI